jgi:hypothetical protein
MDCWNQYPFIAFAQPLYLSLAEFMTLGAIRGDKVLVLDHGVKGDSG